MGYEVTVPVWLLAAVGAAILALVVGGFLWGWRGGWRYAVYERVDLRAALRWERVRGAARPVAGRAPVSDGLIAVDRAVFDHEVREPVARLYPLEIGGQTRDLAPYLNASYRAQHLKTESQEPIRNTDEPVGYDPDRVGGDAELAVWLLPGVPMSPWGASMLREFNRRLAAIQEGPRHAAPEQVTQ